jgi:hypothetical protein
MEIPMKQAGIDVSVTHTGNPACSRPKLTHRREAWLVTVVLAITLCSCEAKRTPAMPDRTRINTILSEMDKLERSLSLAVIAATPARPPVNVDLPDVLGMQDQQQVQRAFREARQDMQTHAGRIDRELAFLKACEKSAELATTTRTSLKTFAASPTEENWGSTWQNLTDYTAECQRLIENPAFKSMVPAAERWAAVDDVKRLATEVQAFMER